MRAHTPSTFWAYDSCETHDHKSYTSDSELASADGIRGTAFYLSSLSMEPAQAPQEPLWKHPLWIPSSLELYHLCYLNFWTLFVEVGCSIHVSQKTPQLSHLITCSFSFHLRNTQPPEGKLRLLTPSLTLFSD